MFKLLGRQRLSGKKNLHLLKRDIFNKPANNCPRLVFANINFFNIQRIGIWMLLNFGNNPNTDIQTTDCYFFFNSSFALYLSTFICKRNEYRSACGDIKKIILHKMCVKLDILYYISEKSKGLAQFVLGILRPGHLLVLKLNSMIDWQKHYIIIHTESVQVHAYQKIELLQLQPIMFPK